MTTSPTNQPNKSLEDSIKDFILEAKKRQRPVLIAGGAPFGQIGGMYCPDDGVNYLFVTVAQPTFYAFMKIVAQHVPPERVVDFVDQMLARYIRDEYNPSIYKKPEVKKDDTDIL